MKKRTFFKRTYKCGNAIIKSDIILDENQVEVIEAILNEVVLHQHYSPAYQVARTIFHKMKDSIMLKEVQVQINKKIVIKLIA